MQTSYANAPAWGEGVGVLLAGGNTETLSEKRAQKQLLIDRFGLSEPVAGLVLDLLRGGRNHG